MRKIALSLGIIFTTSIFALGDNINQKENVSNKNKKDFSCTVSVEGTIGDRDFVITVTDDTCEKATARIKNFLKKNNNVQ